MEAWKMQRTASDVIHTCRTEARTLEREATDRGRPAPAEHTGAAARLSFEVMLRIVSAAAARYGHTPAGDAIEAAGNAIDRAIEAMAQADGLPHD